MGERIDYDDDNYPANYSQFSYGAWYANRAEVPLTNSTPASYVTNNYSQIIENSASFGSTNAHDLASYVSWIWQEDHNEIMARIMQEEKVLLADTTGKEKVGSDINECSAIRTKQHNIHSKQISSQETSLAVEKHGKHKKIG